MKMMKIFLIMLLSIMTINSAIASEAKINEKAPAFTLKDTQGNDISLSDYSGKIVVLEWINYGCPFVKKHYDSKNMQQLQKKFTDKGVIWLAICSSADGKQGYMSNDEIIKMNKEKGVAFSAYLIDDTGKVGKAYGARTTPHMYVIDKSGKLVYAGAIDDKPSTDQSDIDGAKNYVADAINDLMNGRKVKEQVSKPYGCGVKYAK